ncbi:hypothetical protein F5Y17DRAFT_439148 [Xylariaceae sp. FL0594]|nr:hypothetical protein F5Y17DRAFT_439148 [Xylariaceae sp. FL0594]
MPARKITVFRGWKDTTKFVWSPYVTKLEARLRFGGVAYTAEAGSPRSAPKGKIPYVEISPPLRRESEERELEVPITAEVAGTQVLADSTLITKALCDAGVLPDLNVRLSKAERVHDLALRALLEDKMSFYNSWERWTQNYYTMRDHVLWPIPWAVRVFVGSMVYKKTVATLHGQGTGRFSAEEIAMFRREIWESFADLLHEAKAKTRPKAKEGEDDDADNDEPFWLLGGSEPTEVDAVLFGFVASSLLCTAGPESQAEVKKLPILADYARRIGKRFFSDYEPLPL